jgi:hypothetical protein
MSREVIMFEPITILRIIDEQISQPLNDGSRGSSLYTVPFELSRQPSIEWVRIFIAKWDKPRESSSSHQPGIASVSVKTVYLTGTTIEMVEKNHKKTLLLALEDANQFIEKYESEQTATALKESERLANQRQQIQEAAKKIKFE